MYKISADMLGIPRASMIYQIISTDLLSGILVGETGGRGQNMEIREIIILNLNTFIDKVGI